MAKTLFLMRHGEAAHGLGLPDIERELTEAGMRNVRKQSRRIFLDKIPDKFLVSTAMRTRQTIGHMMEEIEIPQSQVEFEPVIYNASVRELFSLVVNLDESWKKVCIIGHNPAISYLAEYLTGEEIGTVSQAGIVKMDVSTLWKEVSQNGVLLDYYLEAE